MSTVKWVQLRGCPQESDISACRRVDSALSCSEGLFDVGGGTWERPGRGCVPLTSHVRSCDHPAPGCRSIKIYEHYEFKKYIQHIGYCFWQLLSKTPIYQLCFQELSKNG